MFKKFLSIILSFVMIFGISSQVFADEINYDNNLAIKSLDVNDTFVDYAEKIFPKHFHAMNEVGDLKGSIENYYLGSPFTLFNVIENTNSKCFPVISCNQIVAILEIVEINGEYNSSLSISFSNELTKMFENKNMDDFVLLTDGVHVQAFDGKRNIEIFKLYEDGHENLDLSSQFDLSSQLYIKNLTLNDCKTKASSKENYMRIPDQPTSYKTLGVAGVSQGNHPWCWAATSAAIINYKKGESLTASDVANYVYPDNPEQGAQSWEDIKKGYNHWGLYPYQTGVVSFSTVKSDINYYKPLHLRIVRNGGSHSVALIGYEDWVGSPGGSNARILILLEPRGGVHKSVELNSSGNFSYHYGSLVYSWDKTRRF